MTQELTLLLVVCQAQQPRVVFKQESMELDPTKPKNFKFLNPEATPSP